MDIADQAAEREAAYLGGLLAEQRRAAALDAPGTDLCADCHDPIPVERRAALPSAIRCINCQAFIERLLNNKNRRTP
jgi:phage/conjugal plasmid C-4 type zinc finger TraR family protein